MLKLIVCIIASENPDYNNFKELWKANINYIKTNRNNKIEYDFYFVYGGETNKINHINYYTELYYDIPETLPNILRKTIRSFEYFSHIYDKGKSHKQDFFVLRTNISTIFDFEKYTMWLDRSPLQNFLGGSMIEGYLGYGTTFSGTNTVMSFDIMKFIIKHQDRFIYTYNEDTELSSLVMYNTNCYIKTMKRLDFLNNKVIFHRCKLYNSDICCYRFKSNDRKRDYALAKIILDLIHNGKNVNDYVIDNFDEGIISSEGEIYDDLSNKIVKVDPSNNSNILVCKM